MMMINKYQINWGKLFFTILRVAIGWHFIYEGMSKLLISNWTSYSYLTNTTGSFSGFYHFLASSEGILKLVDTLNIYGLLLIGIALFTGFFSRLAAFAGAVLLTLYYFAYPPFGDSLFNIGGENLFIVDKIFLEGIALLLILFFKEKGYGLDSVFELINNARLKKQATKPEEETQSNSRREVLKNLAVLPILGIMGWWSYWSRKDRVDVMSGATIQLNQTALGELKGVLPKGKIGNHEISRLVLGGNLIGGSAHSRDLIYVPSLFKAYNTEKKIYETLILAEKAGINAINIAFSTNALMAKYKKLTGSKIIVISQARPGKNGDDFEQINKAIDYGADIIQVNGGSCDQLVKSQKIDVIQKMMDRIKGQGYTAGLAAHAIDSLIICEKNGIMPDYFMKTMHHDQYWSAHPRENRITYEVDEKNYADHNKYHNNIWDLFPEKTIEFVERVKVPVMGYKVLAAGAISPEDGFKWAFMNGADFICVGMFDFQIVNDVNTCLDTLNNLDNRKREWYS